MDELEKTKKWMKRYWEAKERLTKSGERIETIRSSKMGSAVHLDGMPHGHNGTDLSDYAALILWEEEQYCRLQYDSINIRREICDAIERLPDKKAKEILAFRYIQNLRWIDITAQTGLSKGQLMKIHNKALKRLDISYKAPGKS